MFSGSKESGHFSVDKSSITKLHKIEDYYFFDPRFFRFCDFRQILNALKKKSKTLNHGKQLAGDVKQELRLETDFMDKIGWGKWLASSVGNWINKDIKVKITKFNILNTWIVRQFENEYNQSHTHSGHVSGVGYLKVPKNLGEPIQKEKTNNSNGILELVYGSTGFLSDSVLKINPKVGDFYFFPNYLRHLVYPFRNTNEERRSVSFNATIDENIYNSLDHG